MTTQIDFQRHLQIRDSEALLRSADRIRGTLEALKAEGIGTGELIECMGNELHLLKIQDEREFEASTKSLSRSGADLLPTDHSKTTNR
jgi:hypothetical protein